MTSIGNFGQFYSAIFLHFYHGRDDAHQLIIYFDVASAKGPEQLLSTSQTALIKRNPNTVIIQEHVKF